MVIFYFFYVGEQMADKIEKSNTSIFKYAPFFHDGSIMNIRHIGDKIEFSMASAEMDEEDTQGDIILSKESRIEGKLHVEGVKSITINKKPFFGIVKKIYDDGGIVYFKITKNSFVASID